MNTQNARTVPLFEVLYYYPGISETTYGEITNAEEFDKVVAIYQSLEDE